MTASSIPWSQGAGLSGDADHRLIERALGGDRRAFGRVVEARGAYVARLAHRLLGWDPEVEDVVQDVFARAWQKRGQLRDAEKLNGWLSSITVNAVRSRLRRRKLQRAFLLNAGRERRADGYGEAEADGALERDEVGRQVRSAVNALPQRDKEVLVLRYLEHMTVNEVAEALGLRVNAVEVRLHRARKRLAELLPRELRP